MKHLKRHPLRLAVAAAFCASAPFMAHAGTGPYVGLEGGANWENPQNLRFDGSTADTLHFKTGWAAGLVGGFSFANGFRPELEIDHRSNFLKSDADGFSVGGHEYADTLMGNLWYDFKAPTGFFSIIHPYVGAGIGGVRFANRGVEAGGADFDNSHVTEFGYQGGAGVGYDVTPHLTVSADYRYLQSNRGSLNVGLGSPVDARYRANTAMIGVRYSFGSAPAPAPLPPPPPPPVAYAPPPPPAPVCHPPAGFQVDANCHIIEQKLIMRSVDFEFNSAQLTAPSQQTLDGVASALSAQPELAVDVRGYTDSIGSAVYNKKLSQRRAESVKAYLASKGVATGNLKAEGFGKADPIASNDTAEGRAQNRRVEFVVTNAPSHLRVKSEGATAADTAAAQSGEQPAAPVKKKHHHKKKAAAPASDSTTAPASGGDQSAQPAPQQ